jgi:hypothetical protein
MKIKDMFPIAETFKTSIVIKGNTLYRTSMDADPKVMGVLSQKKNGQYVFTKPALKQSEHLFRKTDSYGTNAVILKNLPIDTEVILDLDTGVIKTTVGNYLEHGEVREYGKHGEQYFLARQAFEEVVIE